MIEMSDEVPQDRGLEVQVFVELDSGVEEVAHVVEQYDEITAEAQVRSQLLALQGMLKRLVGLLHSTSL